MLLKWRVETQVNNNAAEGAEESHGKRNGRGVRCCSGEGWKRVDLEGGMENSTNSSILIIITLMI